MKFILVLLLIMVSSVNIHSQEKQLKNGFYRVVDTDSCSNSKDYLTIADSDGKYCIHKNPIITDDNFESVNITADTTNTGVIYTLGVKLDSSGAEKIKEATGKMVGQKAAFVLNNEIVAAPTIRDPIDSGRIAVFCNEETIHKVKKALQLD